MTGTIDDLKRQIRELMVAELMLQRSAGEIPDAAMIFRPEGLGLDSVDALQLVVALEKKFGLKLADAERARQVLQSVNTIAEAVAASESQ